MHIGEKARKAKPKLKWTPISEKPGAMHRSSHGAEILLMARIGYPGSRVSDLRIGANTYQLPNEDIRAAVVDEKRDFDTRSREELGVSGPLRYLTRSHGFVFVRYSGYVPFAMREKDWLALPLHRKSDNDRRR